MEYTHPHAQAALSQVSDFAEANGLRLMAWMFQPSETDEGATVHAVFGTSEGRIFEPVSEDGEINLSALPKVEIHPSGWTVNKLFNPFN